MSGLRHRGACLRSAMGTRGPAELLTDPDWQVEEAAAANPPLPLATMSALVHHLQLLRSPG